MKVSIVTTLYKSSPYIAEFYQRAHAAVSKKTKEIEFIFVDDGSPDDSVRVVRDLMKANAQADIKLLQLSRNFGHHHAMKVGLEHTNADLVFLIDCDLEEPPEFFHDLYEKMQESAKQGVDADVVYAYQENRKGGFVEKISGDIFYRFFNAISEIPIPSNWVTARLMTGAYVKALSQFHEKELFLDGVWILAGFNQVGIPLEKGDKGSSSYTTFKKLSMSAKAITSFSSKPLLIIFALGLFFSILSMLGILVMIVQVLIFKANYDAGWPSVILAVSFFGGLILASLGVLGLYISYIFKEVKQRPIVIKKIWTTK